MFDVEIGQFESVSFNFSQLTGPPWVPHTSLIGNKLVFLSSPPSQFYNPFFFFFIYYRGTPQLFSPSYLFPADSRGTELQLHPDVCQAVSHKHKTSLMLPPRHPLCSERDVLFRCQTGLQKQPTNKQTNRTVEQQISLLCSDINICCGDLCLPRFHC